METDETLEVGAYNDDAPTITLSEEALTLAMAAILNFKASWLEIAAVEQAGDSERAARLRKDADVLERVFNTFKRGRVTVKPLYPRAFDRAAEEGESLLPIDQPPQGGDVA